MGEAFGDVAGAVVCVRGDVEVVSRGRDAESRVVTTVDVAVEGDVEGLVRSVRNWFEMRIPSG